MTTAPLLERYRGRRVLLTGATGFLGQALLEKMLRALPEVEEITLLVRRRGRLSARERLEEVFASRIFRRLRCERPGFDEWWPEKVGVAEGALGLPRLGMDEESWAALASRLTAIIHVGGLASFDEPLDRVLQVNTLGGLEILELAREAGNVPLIHVSTAYVSGKREGTHPEAPLPWRHTPRTLREGLEPGPDPAEVVSELLTRSEHIRRKAEDGHYDRAIAPSLPETHRGGSRRERLRTAYADKRLSRLGRREASRRGWPDPYPMSKAFAEQLMVHRRGDVPLSIVRPAILASSMEEPEPGWLTGLRMTDPIIASMGRGLLDIFPGRDDTILDVVPCDLAVNAILAALPDGSAGEPRVYHVATSDANPLAVTDHVRTWYRALLEHPFVNRQGDALEPTHVRLAEPGQVRLILERRRRWIAVRLAVLERLGRKRRASKLRAELRFLRHAHILGRAYAPYTTRQFRFETRALEGLEQSLAPGDRETFAMDPRRVAWTEYLSRVHVPAVRREAGGVPPDRKDPPASGA
jgi:thioester reductase-like protein